MTRHWENYIPNPFQKTVQNKLSHLYFESKIDIIVVHEEIKPNRDPKKKKIYQFQLLPSTGKKNFSSLVT